MVVPAAMKVVSFDEKKNHVLLFFSKGHYLYIRLNHQRSILLFMFYFSAIIILYGEQFTKQVLLFRSVC